MKLKTYGIYEGDKLIFSGVQPEIRKHFEIRSDVAISTYAKRGIKLLRKYDVKEIGYEKDYDPNVKKTSAYEKELNYLLFHIKYYGNTLTNKDPCKYVKEINNNGYNVRITEHKEGRKKWWYVERI